MSRLKDSLLIIKAPVVTLQELSFSGGNLDQIQAFVVTEEDVELPPITCGESARHLAAKLWAARWRVVPHHALPRWLQDNDYLLKGKAPKLPMDDIAPRFKM